MKKIWMMIAVAFCFQAFAADGADQEEFVARDGKTYSVSIATEEDLNTLDFNLSASEKENRIGRFRQNQFGVFKILNSEGNYEDKSFRVFTGCMQLGFQPYPCSEGSEEEKRSKIILGVFEWLIKLHGTEPLYETLARNSSLSVGIINREFHAARVIFPNELFNCVAAQDAIARLAKDADLIVPPDAPITEAGETKFIISIPVELPYLSSGSRSILLPALPFWPKESGPNKGMQHVLVTSLRDDVVIPEELPADLALMLSEYTAILQPTENVEG